MKENLIKQINILKQSKAGFKFKYEYNDYIFTFRLLTNDEIYIYVKDPKGLYARNVVGKNSTIDKIEDTMFQLIDLCVNHWKS